MEQLTLFDLKSDESYFFQRMLGYVDRLDSNGHHNGVYNRALIEAWSFARTWYEDGAPKAWFYLRNMEAFAENAGLLPKQPKRRKAPIEAEPLSIDKQIPLHFA